VFGDTKATCDAAQLQFDFPNFELWHAGTACDHLGAIASQRFRFFVSRLNNLAECYTEKLTVGRKS
jgi:hypothetical protein